MVASLRDTVYCCTESLIFFEVLCEQTNCFQADFLKENRMINGIRAIEGTCVKLAIGS